MTAIDTLFETGAVTCRNCGRENNLGSGEALFHADLHTTCANCGFRYLDHIDQQMRKLLEMMETNRDWNEWFLTGRNDLIRQHLDRLVPLPCFAQ